MGSRFKGKEVVLKFLVWRVVLVLGLFLIITAACQSDSQATPAAEGTQAAEAGPGERDSGGPNGPENTAEAPEPTATASIIPTVESTATPPPSPTAIASLTATEEPSPSPTIAPSATPLPTATATPTATPTPDLQPEWLAYLNRFRAIGNLPPLTDRESTTLGSWMHSRYMVGNDEPIAHYELEEKPFYDVAGDQAARNGNIFATSEMEANYIWSINFWVSAPFHLIGILNPTLETVGFGEYQEAVGDTQMAAVLDIGSNPKGTRDGIEYPIMFPGDGSETWVVRHSLFEWPYPFDGCPGFAVPTGPPVVILLGDGSKVPDVTNHRFANGDEVLESCLFDETSYRNNDPYAEKIGRQILAHNDAVVIMPRNPLIVGETYTAQVTADGQTTTWQFSVRRGPDS